MINELRQINGQNINQKISYKQPERIKAFIITMVNDSYSSYLTRKMILSIQNKNEMGVDPYILPATIPDTIIDDLNTITHLKNPTSIPWTWPLDEKQDGYCLKTGLYKKTFEANDQRKVIACTVSHMKAWQTCIDINQPIMVLEHDSKFNRVFDYADVKNEDWGILGLNDPIQQTRKSAIFDKKVKQKGRGIHPLPYVDSMNDLPQPQGLAGNSAYIIKPWAAQKLLDKVQEIGMWPNEALMCKQFFPWIRVVYPYYTKVSENVKSTVKS